MATGRQAKIQLQADLKSFRQSIEESKKILKGLGDVKVDDKFSKEMRKGIEENIKQARASYDRHIDGMVKKVGDLAKAGKSGTEEFRKLTIELGKAKREVEGLGRAQSQASRGGGMGRGIGRGLLRGAATAGITLGAGALLQRQFQISEQRQGVMALTGGGIAGDESKFGFSPEQRRLRQQGLGTAFGRDMSDKELSGRVEAGEMAQRAFGTSGEVQANLVRATRQSGGREDKVFKSAIATAMEAGLKGARVTEFLEGMSTSLDAMKEGTILDSSSIRGFAGALSALPIFKDDPSRAFKVMQSMDQSFRGGDRFQQSLFSRAMVSASGGEGASPAAQEVRRGFGLFAGLGEGSDVDKMLRQKHMGKEGQQLADFLNQTSGPRIVKAAFEDITQRSKKTPLDQQLQQFASELKMTQTEALPIFTKIKKGGVGSLTKDDYEQMKDAQRTPQERLNNTFKGLDANMLSLSAALKKYTDMLAKAVGTAADILAKVAGPGAVVAGAAAAGAGGGMAADLMGGLATEIVGGSIVEKLFGGGKRGLPGSGGIVGGRKGKGGLLGRGLKKGGGLLKKGGGLLKGGALAGGHALSALGGGGMLGLAKAAGGVGLAGAAGYGAGTLAQNIWGDEIFEGVEGIFGEAGISDEDAIAQGAKNFKGLPAGSRRMDSRTKSALSGGGSTMMVETKESDKKANENLGESINAQKQLTTATKELTSVMQGKKSGKIGANRPSNASYVNGGAPGKASFE